MNHSSVNPAPVTDIVEDHEKSMHYSQFVWNSMFACRGKFAVMDGLESEGEILYCTIVD